MEVQSVPTYRPKIETPDPRVFDKNDDGEVNAQDIETVVPQKNFSEPAKLDLYA